MFWIILLGVATPIFIFYYLLKPYQYWSDRGIYQGRLIYIFGDTIVNMLRKLSVGEMAEYLYNRFPGHRYYGMYAFSLRALLVKDIDLIKQITVKDFEYFTDHREFTSEDVDPLWGKNLLFLKGTKWHDMRATLSPSFTSSKMKIMFNLMVESSENFVQYFLRKNEEVTTVELKDIFTRLANDVIATCAFGIKVDSLTDQENEFYTMGKRVTNFNSVTMTLKLIGSITMPRIMRLLKIPILEVNAQNFFVNLITETLKTREKKSIYRPDMINLLMEARKGIKSHESSNIIDTGFAVVQESEIGKANVKAELSDIDVTAQAMIFFFAGFDSVSNIMCFAAYELAINQDMQKRLRDEVQQTMTGCGGKLTYEALLGMKYMDMIVSETLRKWPGPAVADRVCTKPYTIEPVNENEKPAHIEKGTVVWIPTYAIHHDPEFYPDPEKFDPERFSDENKDKIRPYTYLPFGMGPRNCIGSRFALLEIKTIFVHILSHFEIVPVEKSIIPIKFGQHPFLMTAEGGFWFGLKRIKN